MTFLEHEDVSLPHFVVFRKKQLRERGLIFFSDLKKARNDGLNRELVQGHWA